MLGGVTASIPPKDLPYKGTRSREDYPRYDARDEEPDQKPEHPQPARLVLRPAQSQVQDPEAREGEAKGQQHFGGLLSGLHGQPLKRARQPSRRDEAP